MAGKPIVTIYINNSYSRYYGAHVRDVAFNPCNVESYKHWHSPTTFFSAGCFSSTFGSSVVVMLLMVTASRAFATWWCFPRKVLVFRQILDGWRPLWSLISFTLLVVTQGVMGVLRPVLRSFPKIRFFCNDKTKNYKNCYRIYFPLQWPIKIIKETIFFKKVRKNENILRNKNTTLVFGSSRLIIVHLSKYPTFRKRKWRRLEDKTNLSIFCKEALEKTPSKLCWKDLKDCVMAHQDNLLRFRIMK